MSTLFIQLSHGLKSNEHEESPLEKEFAEHDVQFSNTNTIRINKEGIFGNKERFCDAFFCLIREECRQYQKSRTVVGDANSLATEHVQTAQGPYDMNALQKGFHERLEIHESNPSNSPIPTTQKRNQSINRRITPTPVKTLKKSWPPTVFKTDSPEPDSRDSFSNSLHDRLAPTSNSPVVFAMPSPRESIYTSPIYTFGNPIPNQLNKDDSKPLELMVETYKSSNHIYERTTCLAILFHEIVFRLGSCSILDSLEMMVDLLLSLPKTDHHKMIEDNLFPQIAAIYHFSCSILVRIDLEEVGILLGDARFQELVECPM